MKKDKWHIYWQKRTVKADETLMTLCSIADSRGYTEIKEMVSAYFKSVAVGEVKDVNLPCNAAVEKQEKP